MDLMEPDEATLLCYCVISSAEGIGSKVKWLISWPLLLLLYITIPNCAKPRWEGCFMLSFILSTLWIAIFSYFMVWMVSVVLEWKNRNLMPLQREAFVRTYFICHYLHCVVLLKRFADEYTSWHKTT